MNTRNAANDKGPDEVTEPNARGAPFDEALPASPDPDVTPRLPTNIQEAIADAVAQVPAHLRGDMRVHRINPGEVSLHDVLNFLKKEFPCFVLFTRMNDDLFKEATKDGTEGAWKVGMDPTGKCSSCAGRGEILDGGAPARPCMTCGGSGQVEPPKREFGVFLNGPETAYDPKMRKVVARWLDATQVRDIGRRS